MFPYLVLTIFFFRGITLRGATVGLAHMFTPKVPSTLLNQVKNRIKSIVQMDMLLKPTVWLDAANQVFYSFGLAFGSIISFGSYNNPKKNCVKAGEFISKYFPLIFDVLQDVIILSICNAFTAIYACAVIFSILGFKAVHLFEKCMEQ